MNIADYEALTVAELKEMADQLGVEIPSDARKADIIEALATQDRESREEEIPIEPEEPGPIELPVPRTMSSTVDGVELSNYDYAILKLVN